MKRDKDRSQSHRHKREFKPGKNQTYISSICDELERLEGLKELYKGNKKEIEHVDHAMIDYRSQYSTLTGTLYISPSKQTEIDKQESEYFKKVSGYKKLAPYTDYRVSDK